LPHITLRHSSNLNDCDFIPFFKELHDLLVEKLDVKLSSCSSMVISHDRYLLGDGHADNAFVHLNIAVKPHIRDDALDSISTQALEQLKSYMSSSPLKIKISVECSKVSPLFKS
jgi:5-carboxymethyl-2-hydroxymuconate isomerase